MDDAGAPALELEADPRQGDCIRGLFRASFGDDRDMDKPSVVSAVGSELFFGQDRIDDAIAWATSSRPAK